MPPLDDDPYAAAGLNIPPDPAAGMPTFSTVPVHPAPDNSGAMTNLSDEDYRKLLQGVPGTGPRAPADPKAPPGISPPVTQPIPLPIPPIPPAGQPGAATAAPAATTAAVPSPAPPVTEAPAKDDPYAAAGLNPPPPEQRPHPNEPPVFHKEEELRNQPWYQGLWDHLGTAFKGMPAAFEHGATMGFDDLVAPIPAAIYRSIAQGVPFSKAYGDVQERYQNERRAFAVPNPDAARATEVAGNFMPMMAAGPLFAPARGAGTAFTTKAADYARNVGVAAGLGGVTGFGMTEGDLSHRLEGAGEGAAISGALQAVFPPLVGVAQGIWRGLRPGAQVPRHVGNILNEQTAGQGQPVHGFQTAPTPGVPLNVAEAAQGPGQGELASLVDKRYAEHPAEMHRLRNLQNQALVQALPRTPTGAYPPQAAAEASTTATGAIKQAAKIIANEEKRLWNKPTLADPQGVSSGTAKTNVDALVRDIRRDEPGLGLALDESSRLRQVVGQLYRMPAKLAAKDLNAIRSRFLAIGRDWQEKGDVKAVAFRLAHAVQEGIFNAPEVAGRAPMAFSDTELERMGLGGGRPTPAAARAAAAAEAAPGQAPTRPQSLADFVIAKGGIRDHQDLTENTRGIHHRAGGRLVNPRGMSVNNMREAAAEEGFLTGEARNDDREFVKALNEEGANRPVFRPEDEAQANAWREAQSEANRRANQMEDYRWQLQGVAEESGGTFTAEEMDHALSIMMNNPQVHPQEALMQASTAGEQAPLQANAQAQAFTPPGMAGAQQARLPEEQIFREGIPANPALAKDLRAAREFTKREAQTLGHATFDNIMRRNSHGNETVVPGTALNKFFDFTNGVERPGAIRDVSRFLDDIRSEWLKLDAAERGGAFNPDAIAQVKADLIKNSRDFIIAKMLHTVSSRAFSDEAGNPMLMPGKVASWLKTNQEMLRRSGMFDENQLGVLDGIMRTAQMIQRGRQTGAPIGSPTYTRATGPNWLGVFVGPLGRILGSRATSIGLGALTGGMVHHETLGAILGLETGNIMERLYAVPHAKLLASLDEAIRDPQVAAFLMQKAGSAPKGGTPEPVRRWLRALLAISPTGEMARSTSQPAQMQGAQ
jgi:hypothetical protein